MPPGQTDPPRRGLAGTLRRGRRRLKDSVPKQEREQRPGFDWDAAVALYAPGVWQRAAARSASALDALEVFQLAWLRLELTARDGTVPADLGEWLLHEVEAECARRPLGSASDEPRPDALKKALG